MNEIEETLNAWIQNFLEVVSDNIVKEAKSNLINTKTGKLKDSIKYEKVSENEYKIFTDCGYGAFVEFGTRAHRIIPINKKSLKFEIDGKTFFAKAVNHPGTKPSPYFEPAINLVIQKLEKKEL